VREGELEEVTSDGERGVMWHLFLFNDLLLWTRPVYSSSSSASTSSPRSSFYSISPSSSATTVATRPTVALSSSLSASGGWSPTASPRSARSLFCSADLQMSRPFSAESFALREGKYEVQMIDDLVHLTVTEVPLASQVGALDVPVPPAR